MNIALWIVHILLVAFFMPAGYVKTFTPMSELNSQMAWVTSVPVWVVRLPGIAELSAALALIIIPIIKKYTFIVPLAAIGLTIVMILSVFVPDHASDQGIFNLVVGGLSAFLAWGRWKMIPLGERS